MIVPDRPSELGIDTLDGVDEWRSKQKDTIQEIYEAFQTRRFVLANMPPGSGKTIVGAAVQKMLGADSLSLTHTIQLQKQYQRTFPHGTLITGRSNHACELEDYKGKTAAVAPCAFGADCEWMHINGCSYYRTIFTAAENPQAIANYAYATRILQSPGGRVMKRYNGNPFWRELLICDEGDLAEQACIEAARVSFKLEDWEHILPRIPSDSDDLEEWRMWGYTVYNALRRQRDDVPSDDDDPPHNRLIQEVEKLWQIDPEKPDEWAFERDDKVVSIRPIWGWTVAERVLWGKHTRTLIMSATIGNPHTLARKLDLPKNEWYYIDVPSTFPIANRTIFYWPVIRVSRTTSDIEWSQLARGITMLTNNPTLSDKKGIVHSGSYSVAKSLWKQLQLMSNGRDWITHRPLPSSLSREQALVVFKQSQEPLGLLSPSFTTGVDLPYTIAWQVIAKVPFGNLGDPIVKARRDYVTPEGEKFGRTNYDEEAMAVIVQAAGRAVRAPDDRGVTYIVDGNFWPLYKRIAYKPQHFKEAFRWL